MSVTLGVRPAPAEELDGDEAGGRLTRASLASTGTPGRWRPDVRSVLFLVVLLPTIATVVLTASSASSNWSSRAGAQTIARDAAALNQVALARLQFNIARVPVMAVGFAENINLSEAIESKLLGIDLGALMAKSTRIVDTNRVFHTNEALRTDVANFANDKKQVEAGSISYPVLKSTSDRFADDIDNLWYADYNRLENDASAWRPPGNFDIQVAALRQAYVAFLQGGFELEGTIYVQEGVGGTEAKQEVIQSSGIYRTLTLEFQGKLGPRAEAQWNSIQMSSTDRQFQRSVEGAVAVALGEQPPQYVSDPILAGVDMRHGLGFLTDVDNLVREGSNDLGQSADAVASHATGTFIGETIFLVLLIAVSIGGAVVAGRVLTRPLKRLSTAAQRIHSGDFGLDPLPESGPREVVTTTTAFNDMATTLKGVEAKTMALATEDMEHPELQRSLPGRTGQALQVAVDKLSASIREREAQRQQLEHTATHDSLTTLYNRSAIFDLLRNDVDRRRQAGETVGVLFVDLNGLKQLNDTYGHDAGDAAIVSTSEALIEATTPCCVVGRLGGDEFLVVLCTVHSQDSDVSASKMREAVSRRSIPVEGRLIPLSASVGLALTRCDAATDPMALVRIADDAMYEAKKVARMARDQLAVGVGEPLG